MLVVQLLYEVFRVQSHGIVELLYAVRLDARQHSVNPAIRCAALIHDGCSAQALHVLCAVLLGLSLRPCAGSEYEGE